jgi:tetratricopeptide (TPR) repeat protein
MFEGRRPYLWIAASVFVLYFKSLWFGYTHLDDNILILGNERFLSSLSNVAEAFMQKVFAKSFLPYYRPVLMVSLILDTKIGSGAPLFYHLTNIALHAGASCLVAAFLLSLGYGRLESFLSGMIFAVHPALSQGVAWIPGRNDTLLAVSVLGAFIAFLRMMRDGRSWPYLAHVALFLAALFTKETALVVIPLGLIYMYLVAGEKLISRKSAALWIGWSVSVLVWHQFRSVAVQGTMPLSFYDMACLQVAYLPALIQFAGKIFFPFNLSVFPIIADTGYAFGAAAVTLLACAVIFTKKRRYRYIVFGAAWAVLFLLPSLIRANFRISADFLEHRVYVPVIGVFVVLLETDFVRKAPARSLAAGALIVIAVFASITFRHIDNFRDRSAFWLNAVRTSPHSSFAHLAMALSCHESGRLDEAAGEYRSCLAIDPSEPGAFYGLGKIYLAKGLEREAEAELRKTIAVYPYYANAHIELGALYHKEGRLAEAERCWVRAFGIEPKNPVTNKFLAIYYFEKGDLEKSRVHAKILEDMGLRPPEDFLKKLGAEGP